jgi:hypothetical protein
MGNRCFRSASGALLAILCSGASLLAQTGPALQVSNPIVSQFEDGGSIPAGQKLVPGETVYFRFSAAGFKTSESGRVQLTGHAQAIDPEGAAIIPRDEVVVATSLRDEDKEWKPVLRFQFQIPSIARPGTYHIRFEATDDQTKKTASGDSTFQVSGVDLAPSPTLVVRGLNFYRTADDETPLRVAAYRAGDMVWVRFDVTGYKYGEQNAIDLTYDVAVTSMDGKPLVSQQNAATERSQAFYPQPWVPGSFSLTLQPNRAKGLYNVEITARDGVGNQTVKASASFRVD